MDEKEYEQKRRFAGEKIASMKRRMVGHDYHHERFYMITFAVEGRLPVLGRLEYARGDTAEDIKNVGVTLSSLGEAVCKEWLRISTIYPQVAVIAVQVMPDHLHGILYVREHTSFHLGQVIKGFKLGCNRKLRRLLAEEAAMESLQTREGGRDQRLMLPVSEEGRSRYPLMLPGEGGMSQYPLLRFASILSKPIDKAVLWENGYNDKILHRYSNLETWKAYLKDNPRRMAIRKLHPEFFRVRFGIKIGPNTFSAIGNRFLLTYPEKAQVQLSRSLTEEEIAKQVDRFLDMARSGTVLVSPAISKGEQAVMRAALDAGLPLIFLTPWGFNTFSKPGHRYYDACCAGRFLILAPWPHHNERIPLTRGMCLELNKMTAEVCRLENC